MTCTSTGTSLVEATATVTGTSPPPPFLPPLPPAGAAPFELVPLQAAMQRRSPTIPACIRIQTSFFDLRGRMLPRSRGFGIRASSVLGDTTHSIGYRTVLQ